MALTKPFNCLICGGTNFWLRTAWGYGYVCSRCHPQPPLETVYDTKDKGGRPRLNIEADRLIKALIKTKDVSEAASLCACSRAYIYKIIGKDKIRQVIGSKLDTKGK